jgi:C4-dicarboxylate transporter DctM subunit
MTLTLFIMMMVLLIGSVPVYVSLGLSAVVALAVYTSLPLEVLAQRMFSGIDKFSLMAVPFFILAANVMKGGGLSIRILKLAQALVGHFRGGLAMTVVLSCMFFGAVSGSSPATVIAIGGLMLPALRQASYGESFSLGLITSSSAVAVIIPPSIGMIVYGSVTGTSVGDLFMAGIGPGILFGGVFMIYSYIHARKHKIETLNRASLSEVWNAFKDAGWALGIPVLILGGIYGGFFTPTEAAAVASVYAIFVSLFIYKDLSIKGLLDETYESAIGTSQVMILLAAASVFSWLLTRQQVPQAMTETLMAISNSKFAILLMINVLLLITGMFIDPASSTTILAPLLLPVALSFGIDPVHLGIIMVVNGAIGMYTPPFGLNLFVATGISSVSISSIIRGAVPFIILSLVTMALVTYIPIISLWLPRVMR